MMNMYSYSSTREREDSVTDQPIDYCECLSYAVTVRDGITMDVWVDRDERGDGRDEEAKAAFQRVFLLSDVNPSFLLSIHVIPLSSSLRLSLLLVSIILDLEKKSLRG